MQTATPSDDYSDLPIPDVFIAARTDGVGERFSALVNARILATVYDRELRFKWDARPDAAVLPVEDTFEARFIEDHGIEFGVGTRDGSLYSANRSEPHPFGELTRIDVDGASKSAVVVNSRRLPKPILERAATASNISGGTFRHFFLGLPFVPELRRALDLAGDVPLPTRCTALHLRGGDIVEGRYRYDLGRFLNKVLPFPVALKLVEQELAAGNKMLLFGEDPFLCRALVARYDDVTFAGDLPAAAGMTGARAALFEIALMARCRRTLAGTSAFAAFASSISEAPVTSWWRVVPKETEPSVVEDAIARPEWASFPPLQRAFARWHAIYLNWENIPALRRSEHLLEALADDPGNGMYPLLAAASLAEAGLPAAAELILMQALAEDERSFRGRQRYSGIRRVASARESPQQIRSRKYIDSLAQIASARYPYTAFVVALAYRQLQETHDLATQHLAMFRESADQKLPDLRAVLLDFADGDPLFQGKPARGN